MTRLDYAIRYAKHGWQVLPLYEIESGSCACGKSDCHSPGKHPRIAHGLTNASTDLNVIEMWWKQWPTANIGIRTGAESGIIVIDADGQLGLQAIGSRGWTPTIEAETGGGGRHLVYAHPGEHVKTTAKVVPGVDSRADGGYIVVEPSNHISGGEYTWNEWPWSRDEPLPEAPSWWIAELSKQGTQKQYKAQSDGETISTGGRNNALTSFAGKLRNMGCEFEEILAGLLARNKAKCVPPLDDTEVEAIAKSICGYAIYTDEEKKYIEKGNQLVASLMESWDNERKAFLKHKKISAKRMDPPKAFVPHHGLIRDIYDWIMDTSRYQLPYLAMAAASSFVSVLIGQKYIGHTGLTPNLYVVGLAPSGGGKDHARSCIDLLATRCGLDSLLGGARIASGSALVSAIEENPVQLYQLDEFGLMLQLMTDKKASGHKKELMDLMMQIYTTTGVFRGTDYADRKVKKRKPVENPIVSIYGTSTPSEFYKALSSGSADNGFLGRMIFINGGDDVKDKRKYRKDPPQTLIDAVKTFYEQRGDIANLGRCEAIRMSCPDDVDEAWNFIEDEQRNRGDDTTRPIYRRAHANIMKLAIVFSLSMGRYDIDYECYAMARDVVLWSIDTIIEGMHNHVSDSDSERESKMVENAIRNAGVNGITASDLFRKTRSIKKFDRENIISDLLQAELITYKQFTADGACKPTTVIVHNDHGE